MTIRLVLVSVAVSLLPVAPAAAKGCPKGKTKRPITYTRPKASKPVTVKACVPKAVPTPGSPQDAIGAIHRTVRDVALALAPKKVRKAASSRSARKVRAADGPSDSRAGAVVARTEAISATVRRGDSTQTSHNPRGTTTVTKKLGAEYDDAEPEPGFEVVLTVDTESNRIGGLVSRKAKKTDVVQRMSRCPDASGIGHGRVRYADSERFVMGDKMLISSVVFDATVDAQFDDAAKIASVVTKGGFTWTTSTRRRGREESRHESRDTVTKTAMTGGGVELSTSGPTSDAGMAPSAYSFSQLVGTFIPEFLLTEMLKDAQRRALSGKCVHVVPEPATVTVKPGESVAFAAHLTDYDNATIDGNVHVLSTSAGGGVAPTDGTAFTYTALPAQPPGGQDVVILSHVSKRGKADGARVTVTYETPPKPPGLFSGTFEGTWTTETSNAQWSYTGNAQFTLVPGGASPPQNAEPGEYNRYTLTTGTADIAMKQLSSNGCGLKAVGQVVLLSPSDAVGSVVVQAKAGPPYFYEIDLADGPPRTITATRTGADESCHAGEETQVPIPGVFIRMNGGHLSYDKTLAGDETFATPEAPFDYDTFSKWEIAPSG